jgi:hypothetical protein
MMRVQPELVSDLARALEHQVEVQAEAAKRAIREYKKSILEEPVGGGNRRIESQREVQQLVGKYIQLRRRLDEVLGEMNTSSPS